MVSQRSAEPKLLLLTGIPGTGKTTLGDYLQRERGFRHLDFESGILGQYINGNQVIDAQVAALKASGDSAVITWGFLPAEQLAAVLRLRELGFEWFWLDGSREAATQAFLKRGTVTQELLDLQLSRIAEHLDPRMDELQPVLIDTFDEHGQHRALDEIVEELLDGRS